MQNQVFTYKYKVFSVLYVLFPLLLWSLHNIALTPSGTMLFVSGSQNLKRFFLSSCLTQEYFKFSDFADYIRCSFPCGKRQLLSAKSINLRCSF